MGSGIAYGQLGVVGNMVVAGDHRRRGLGTRVLEAVLAFLASRGVGRVELFATPSGRLLYERHGFAVMAPSGMVELAVTAVRDLATDATTVREATPADLDRIAAYDLPRYGADRSVILRSALADPDRPLFLATNNGELVGFAVLRPGGPRMGPWLAEEPVTAGALAAAATARLPASAVLITSVPGENTAGWAWFESLGARIVVSDGRMARGAGIARRLETIYGNTMGALG